MRLTETIKEACATKMSPKEAEWRNKEKKGERLGHEGPQKLLQNSYSATESPFSLVPSAVVSLWWVNLLIATRTKAKGAVSRKF